MGLERKHGHSQHKNVSSSFLVFLNIGELKWVLKIMYR